MNGQPSLRGTVRAYWVILLAIGLTLGVIVMALSQPARDLYWMEPENDEGRTLK